jgi:phage terminase small subunit
MKSGTQHPIPEPPGHLSERSQALWRELVRRRCNSAERQLLLECALTDLDRADALREQVAHEGVVVTSARSKLVRAHPALKIEAEMRRRFLAAWRALDLTWPSPL